MAKGDQSSNSGAVQGTPVNQSQDPGGMMTGDPNGPPPTTMPMNPQQPSPYTGIAAPSQPDPWAGYDPALVQIYKNAGVQAPGARGAGFTDAAYWQGVGPSQYARLAADLAGRGSDQPGPQDIGNTSGSGQYANPSGGSNYGGLAGPDMSNMFQYFAQMIGGMNQQPQMMQQPQQNNAQSIAQMQQYNNPKYNPNYGQATNNAVSNARQATGGSTNGTLLGTTGGGAQNFQQSQNRFQPQTMSGGFNQNQQGGSPFGAPSFYNKPNATNYSNQTGQSTGNPMISNQ